MSTMRLTFSYPHLFRTGPARLAEPAAHQVGMTTNTPRRVRKPHASPFSACVSARHPPGFAKRHGKAVEPLPLQEVAAKKGPPSAAAAGEEVQASSNSVQGSETDAIAGRKKTTGNDVGENEKSSAAFGSGSTTSSENDAQPNPEPTPSRLAQQQKDDPASFPVPEPPLASCRDSANVQVVDQPTKNKSGPMQAILHLGPAEDQRHKPPHLTPPPYVHHFDSYSLVRQLEAGGYSRAQAITAMKAVRLLLASHLEVAQESLISKIDVENESYLFKAACSELSTEIKNNRRLADDQNRTQRTMLQHEVDNLHQMLNQELLTLNDNVRGMFNHRNMAVREEQKSVESAVQKINYKISVMLNSDARSEIEQLRWVLIRRSVAGILFMAVLMLGSLRYANYLSHQNAKELDRAARGTEEKSRFDGRIDPAAGPEAVAAILAAG